MIIFSFLSSSTGSPVPSESAFLDHPGRLPEQSSPSQHHHQKISTVALHSTEALMAGFLKSTDLGPHGPHGYGGSHHPHHGHPHGPLPPGMPMTSLAPFGLPHGLDAVGFPQGMWGKYSLFSTSTITHPLVRKIRRAGSLYNQRRRSLPCRASTG